MFSKNNFQILYLKKTLSGNELRTQLNKLKVTLGLEMDNLKEMDLESTSEEAFESKMNHVKAMIQESKMLRAQAKAVVRELDPITLIQLYFVFAF